MGAQASYYSIHICPSSWPEALKDFQAAYEILIENYSGTASSFLNKDYVNNLHAIVKRNLEPIGEEFNKDMRAKGFDVEKLGNLTAFRIINGLLVRLNKSQIDDCTYNLLLDLDFAQPSEENLLPGLKIFAEKIGKDSNELERLHALCLQYLRGEKVGIFSNLAQSIDESSYQKHPELDDATGGSCFHLKNDSKLLGFSYVLQLPNLMYVSPSMVAAFEGDKGMGPLLETRIQYKEPSIITNEFLEQLKSTKSEHLPPIVGSLLSLKELERFKLELPDNYTLTYAPIYNNLNKKGIQTSLLQNNIFNVISASPVQNKEKSYRSKRKRKTEKPATTLDSFTD